MKKKKIAMFSGYYLPHTGGVERYIYNLSQKLYEKGYEIILVSTKYNENLPYFEDLKYAKIYRLPIYKLFSSRYPLIRKNKEYKEIIKKLKNEKIDSIILNTRFQLTTLVGAKFAKKNGISACVIEHGSSHFTVYNKILDFFGHIYEHALTKVIRSLVSDFYGVSLAASEWLNHYKIKSKGTIYNAIEISEYKKYNLDNKKNNDKIEILFAGRLLKDKGILLLIEAFKNLKNKYSNISLFIAGDGPLRNEIEKESKDVKLLGKLNHDDMMKRYSRSDIFINPSYTEGLPTSVLEAGLMKCAVIATPVGGTVEIINDNVNGLFCDTDVESIENKLSILINDETKRLEMGELLHKKIVKDFSWDNTSNKLIEYLNL